MSVSGNIESRKYDALDVGKGPIVRANLWSSRHLGGTLKHAAADTKAERLSLRYTFAP